MPVHHLGLATVGGGDDAARERLAILDDSLWVTGRGTPLLQIDLETGTTRRSIDIDGTGIDIVAAAGRFGCRCAPRPSTARGFRP